MIRTLPDPTASLLPQWVKEALAKQLRTQFPAAIGQKIDWSLEQAAGLMEPVYSLSTLLAMATVILREREPRRGS